MCETAIKTNVRYKTPHNFILFSLNPMCKHLPCFDIKIINVFSNSKILKLFLNIIENKNYLNAIKKTHYEPFKKHCYFTKITS